MDATTYYSLPLHVADRLELQAFLIADHFFGFIEKECNSEPLSQKEIFNMMMVSLP